MLYNQNDGRLNPTEHHSAGFVIMALAVLALFVPQGLGDAVGRGGE